MITVKFDPEANAASIYLAAIPREIIRRNYLCDVLEVGHMINLHFYSDILLDIEILDATKALPPQILKEAIVAAPQGDQSSVGRTPSIEVTYDSVANAAYIYLAEILPGGVDHTYPCDVLEVGHMINLDFDSHNVLIGIEVLDATKALPAEILNEARPLGRHS